MVAIASVSTEHRSMPQGLASYAALGRKLKQLVAEGRKVAASRGRSARE